MTDYTKTNGDLEAVDSNHPVLTNLKSRIAELENDNSILHATIAKQNIDYDNLQTAKYELGQRYIALTEKIRVELLEVAGQYPHDKDIIADIANRLDADLTETKTYEVNVTFKVDVEMPFGTDEDPNFDWDFDFSVDSSNYDIQDYSSDVIYGNEA